MEKLRHQTDRKYIHVYDDMVSIICRYAWKV